MTGDGNAGFSGVAATLAALVAGLAAFTFFLLAEAGGGRMLVAVAVVAAGFGGYFGLRGPLGGRFARGIGSGFVVFGAQLLGASLLADVSPSDGVPVALLGYGLPALAMVLFAVLGMRVWAAGAGIVLPSVLVLVLQGLGGQTLRELSMLVVAVLLTALVVVLPARTRWGAFAGAAAATCALYASGTGLSLFIILGWVITPDLVQFGSPADGVLVACSIGSVLVAGVLVMLAAVRREPATGLAAAAVLVLAATGPGLPFVWVPLAAFVLALVALRLAAVRQVIARLPVVLRGRGEAATAAGCAAVAGGALVMFAWHGLPELDVSRPITGASTLVALLISGALAHFLPTRAGVALAVVTLVVLLLGRPWALLFGVDGSWRVNGAVAMLALAVAVTASWVLIQRHNRPAVWAASAYLMLGSLSDVIAPLLGLSPVDASAGHVVTLLLPLVLIGVLAIVLSTWHRAIRRWQAVATVVVGSMISVPAYVTLGAMVPDGVSLGLPVNPLVPTDTWASTAFLDESGAGAVLVTIVVLALGSVVSLARRPVAPVAVTAALVLYATVTPAMARMKGADTALGVLLIALVVAALALAGATWFLVRRHASGSGIVQRA